MINYKQAIKRILQNTNVMSSQRAPIEDSVGCVLKKNSYSEIEMPPFNKSAMDGYALKAKDTKRSPANYSKT